MAGKTNIFVLDDDEVFLYVMEDIIKSTDLRELHFNLENDPVLALDYLDWCMESGKFPTIIFVDLSMPKLSGFEFLRIYENRYNQRFPDTKIVIITSSALDSDKQQAFQYTFVKDYLLKPVSYEVIKEVLGV